MEYRKLISFGKNSFVISLPKAWVRQQKLEKGDLVYVEETNTDLVLRASPHDLEEEQKEVTIDVDKKEMRQVKREIIAAYIRNNKTITLVGDEIKTKARDIARVVQSLVALEVMEQTSSKVVAKDFLNVDSVSTRTIVRKMDIIVRSMFEDSLKTFDEDTTDSIDLRDNDVNKLAFLMFKIVKFGLENPAYVRKKLGIQPIDAASLWWLAFDLELIADEIKRVARYMAKIEFDAEKQKEFTLILEKIRQNYLKTMKAYYDKNMELVHEVINNRMELIELCDKFYLENRSKKWIGFAMERTKSLMSHVTHLGRVLYMW